jgi:hypothetical protein
MLDWNWFSGPRGHKGLIILISMVCSVSPLFGRQFDESRHPTVDGAAGLFKTWDAEPLRQGEVFASLSVLQNHRDPGELTITNGSGGMAIGLFNRLELIGNWEAQKRIQADGIQVYRIRPGDRSRPSTTRLGEQFFSSSAPFMDVPLATGRGELYGYVKYNLLSERREHPLAVSIVGEGKIPGQKTFTGLNRGLSTGDNEVGLGLLLSKRVGDRLQLHANGIRIYVGHPAINGVGISDIDNRMVVRAGGAFNLTPKYQAIAEFESFNYFYWLPVRGLNPTDPVDLILGMRASPNSFISFGGGYVASLRRISEDPVRDVRPGSVHGFIAQVGFAIRR